MLANEAKVKIIENFYAIDYILLGKKLSEVEVCCPVFQEEYVTIKGNLLSVLGEMYRLVEYSPKINKDFSIKRKSLIENASKIASNCINESKKILKNEGSKDYIRERIRQIIKENKDSEIEPEKIVEHEILFKSFGIALDNLLIKSMLNESKDYKQINEWEGRILEDSYKFLKEELINTAIFIIKDGLI